MNDSPARTHHHDQRSRASDDVPASQEAAWIDGLRRRDASSLEAVIAQHGDFVHRVALRLGAHADDAEDITQETFLRLWRRPPGPLRRARLTTWLYRTARNVAREEARRRRRIGMPTEPSLLQSTIDESANETGVGSPDPRRAAELGERDAALEAAVRQLPERQREVVLLRAYEECSVAETARLMGCREGTVKAHFAKAVANLRRSLGVETEQADVQDRGAERVSTPLIRREEPSS